MKKVIVMGCGHIGSFAAQALKDGKARYCSLEAVYARRPEQAAELSAKLGCKACSTVEDVIALKPDFVIEAARQDFLSDNLKTLLEAGISVIVVSMGVFADKTFYDETADICLRTGSRVYLASGCMGAFDIASAMDVLGNNTGTAAQYKIPGPGMGPSVPDGFSGTALEGFRLSAGHLNSVIAASVANGGTDKCRFEVREAAAGENGFGLDSECDDAVSHFRLVLKPGHGPFNIVAASCIALLNRLTDPISF